MSTQSVNSGQLVADAEDSSEAAPKVRHPGDGTQRRDSRPLPRLRCAEARPPRTFRSHIYRFDVELEHERNRRQRKNCQHVEITARGRGPVVRGEACADSFYGAFEAAVHKLENRLRRSKDRRKVHYGDKTPVSLHQATAAAPVLDAAEAFKPDGSATPAAAVEDHEPGRIVRTKDHPAKPMTVDDALYEMELVGHDFFLFHDKESDRPSVVYRRHAYDYGLIRLS